ncbi:MAG: response regulator [Anaerolineales bacterium]|nr:response regulator [Anaerolineales bacterium]
MENIATVIDSIATILWPLIVIIILFSFRKNIRSLIKSSETRKFTVKIGEMELSMDELSKQQGDMIKDLQTRVNELQRELDSRQSAPVTDDIAVAAAEEGRTADKAATAPDKPTPKSVALDIDDDISDILWVDDHPRNNAFLIDSLKYNGITVSTAEDTQEALDRFKRGSFDCVISDSCRYEGKEFNNCHAGFELASQIREIDQDIPIYIYTDKVNEKMKQKARSVGATAVTSSPSELLKMLSD